jgi:ABC-type Fe3+-hydroxamate transport system substrate-binding protein
MPGPTAKLAAALALAALAWGVPAQPAGAGEPARGGAAAGGAAGSVAATPALRDDLGNEIRLAAPPRRIVSLAPHATELLFAAGLGDRIVGVDPDSDHPPAARGLPKVGALPEPAVERLLALEPDLVVAWAPAVRPGFVARMARLGVPVFVSDPRTLDAVSATLARFEGLRGHAAATAGHGAAVRFDRDLAALRSRWAGREPVRVFVQIWGDPLITISDRDMIGDAIAACGGVNVAADLPGAAPRIDVERVLAAAPKLVVATDSADAAARWRRLGLLRPDGPARFAWLDPVVLQRPGPRVLGAVAALCEEIDAARHQQDAARLR